MRNGSCARSGYTSMTSPYRENDLAVVEMEYLAPETRHRQAVDTFGSITDVEILVEY